MAQFPIEEYIELVDNVLAGRDRERFMNKLSVFIKLHLFGMLSPQE
ncbi:hypothetical protein [Shewanella livingstonensis]|nr:hypothetical protein [Shewanella livingstonensis]